VPFLLRAIDFVKVPCEVVRVRRGAWKTLDCLGQHCFLCPFEQGSILFLKFSALLACPFSSLFVRDSRLLLGLFMSISVGVSEYPAYPAISLGYMRQK